MSNVYAQTSEKWEIPQNKQAQAQQIVDDFLKDHEDSGIIAEMEADGLWIAGESFIDTSKAVELARLLVEQLDIGPLCMEVAHTCSRPVCGVFGGTAFRVAKGKETEWITTGDIRY